MGSWCFQTILLLQNPPPSSQVYYELLNPGEMVASQQWSTIKIEKKLRPKKDQSHRQISSFFISMQDYRELKQPKMSFSILDGNFYRNPPTHQNWLLLITTFSGHCNTLLPGHTSRKLKKWENVSMSSSRQSANPFSLIVHTFSKKWQKVIDANDD